MPRPPAHGIIILRSETRAKGDEVNIYDFDKTIYRDDSTVDFYRYCLRHNKKTLLALPRTALYGLKYLTGFCDKTAFKQAFFSFLKYLDDTPSMVESFWKVHADKIKECYRKRRRSDDIIISASPEFLLRPVCKDGVLIASRVDPSSGVFSGKNCFGPEKVVRLRELYPDCRPEEFYSDSLSDTPLAEIAREAYIVQGDRLIPWAEYAKNN